MLNKGAIYMYSAKTLIDEREYTFYWVNKFLIDAIFKSSIDDTMKSIILENFRTLVIA